VKTVCVRYQQSKHNEKDLFYDLNINVIKLIVVVIVVVVVRRRV